MLNKFENYCKQEENKREFILAYSNQQNGLAKRKNRSILKGVRSIISGTNVHKFLCKEAAKTINYI